MKTFTISEAKAKLSALIDAAEHGEQIFIMRGSRPAVALTPVSKNDLSHWPAVPKSALIGFDRELEVDREAGQLKPLRSAKTAAKARRR